MMFGVEDVAVAAFYDDTESVWTGVVPGGVAPSGTVGWLHGVAPYADGDAAVLGDPSATRVVLRGEPAAPTAEGRVDVSGWQVVAVGDRSAASAALSRLGVGARVPVAGRFWYGSHGAVVGAGPGSDISGGMRVAVSAGERSQVAVGDFGHVIGLAPMSTLSAGDMSFVGGGELCAAAVGDAAMAAAETVVAGDRCVVNAALSATVGDDCSVRLVGGGGAAPGKVETGDRCSVVAARTVSVSAGARCSVWLLFGGEATVGEGSRVSVGPKSTARVRAVGSDEWVDVEFDDGFVYVRNGVPTFVGPESTDLPCTVHGELFLGVGASAGSTSVKGLSVTDPVPAVFATAPGFTVSVAGSTLGPWPLDEFGEVAPFFELATDGWVVPERTGRAMRPVRVMTAPDGAMVNGAPMCTVNAGDAVLAVLGPVSTFRGGNAAKVAAGPLCDVTVGDDGRVHAGFGARVRAGDNAVIDVCQPVTVWVGDGASVTVTGTVAGRVRVGAVSTVDAPGAEVVVGPGTLVRSARFAVGVDADGVVVGSQRPVVDEVWTGSSWVSG